MKLQQQKQGQFMITVPTNIIKGFGWKKGDILEFKIIGNGEIKLFKKKY